MAVAGTQGVEKGSELGAEVVKSRGEPLPCGEGHRKNSRRVWPWSEWCFRKRAAI